MPHTRAGAPATRLRRRRRMRRANPADPVDRKRHVGEVAAANPKGAKVVVSVVEVRALVIHRVSVPVDEPPVNGGSLLCDNDVRGALFQATLNGPHGVPGNVHPQPSLDPIIVFLLPTERNCSKMVHSPSHRSTPSVHFRSTSRPRRRVGITASGIGAYLGETTHNNFRERCTFRGGCRCVVLLPWLERRTVPRRGHCHPTHQLADFRLS